MPIGGIFFITPRLNGSIPKTLIWKWQREKDLAIQKIREQFKPQKDFTGKANAQLGQRRKLEISNAQKMYFKKIDDYLDMAQFGPTWLKDPRVAGEVIKKIKEFDQVYYDLIAYSVMYNHFHLVVDTSIQLINLPNGVQPNEENYKQVGHFMGLIKGASAFESNKMLGRKGRFWWPESFDHWIRNQQEFYNSVRYTVRNPEKAGVVKNWKDHPFTYLKPGFGEIA